MRVPAAGLVTDADLEMVEVMMTEINTEIVVPPAPEVVVQVVVTVEVPPVLVTVETVDVPGEIVVVVKAVVVSETLEDCVDVTMRASLPHTSKLKSSVGCDQVEPLSALVHISPPAIPLPPSLQVGVPAADLTTIAYLVEAVNPYSVDIVNSYQL